MLTKISVHEFFSKMAKADAPGSGSGAALLGLTGVSLMEMASSLCQNAAGEIVELRKLQEELTALHSALEALIDRDAEVLARALPALTAVGPDGSSREWNDVLTQAVEVPFAIAQACIDAIEIAKRLLDLAVVNTACDLKFAAMSCHTGLQGAVLLAELNISLLRGDAGLGGELREKADALVEKAGRALDRALA